MDKSFSVTGKTRGADLTHNLVLGDNFISPAVKAATNVTTVLSSLIQNTDWSDVKRFNATTQAWESYAGGAFTQFEPGKGYNIIGLRSASFSSGKTETATTFVYDSTGARVKKTAGSVTTVYLGKDFEVEGSASTKYIFLGDRRIATKQSTGSFFFFHSDHISSSNVITDSAGNQAALYEYDPYGSTVTHTGSASVKHQFTGQEKDDSTGLLYYNARYYDPQLGRFITADSIVPDAANPQEFNRYSYVNNNPIKFTDPTGHKKKSFWKKFFKALIIAVVVVAVAIVAIAALSTIAVFAGLGGGVAGGAAGVEGGFGLTISGASSWTTAGIVAGGAVAGGGAGAITAKNLNFDSNRGGISPQLTAQGFDEAIGNMLDRVGTGIAGSGPPSLLNNLPNYGTTDTPNLGGIGAPAAGVVQGASKATNLEAGVVNPVEPAYNANESRANADNKSINQGNQDIKKGKAPKSIIRIDKGNPELGEKPHVHFDDGTAMNQDGTLKHGSHNLTNAEREFLRKYAFNI